MKGLKIKYNEYINNKISKGEFISYLLNLEVKIIDCVHWIKDLTNIEKINHLLNCNCIKDFNNFYNCFIGLIIFSIKLEILEDE